MLKEHPTGLHSIYNKIYPHYCSLQGSVSLWLLALYFHTIRSSLFLIALQIYLQVEPYYDKPY